MDTYSELGIQDWIFDSGSTENSINTGPIGFITKKKRTEYHSDRGSRKLHVSTNSLPTARTTAS